MKIKHSVSSPKKVWEEFFLLKKIFKVEQTFFGQFMEGLFYMGSHYHMQGGRKSFTDAFSSNLNSVNLKIFPIHGGRHTWK